MPGTMSIRPTREIGYVLPQTEPPSPMVWEFCATINSSITARILEGQVGDSEKAALLPPAPGTGGPSLL